MKTALPTSNTIEGVKPFIYELEAERNLYACFLLRALVDLKELKGKQLRVLLRWFDNDSTKDPFSFVSTCHVLGLEVESTRKLAKAISKNGIPANLESLFKTRRFTNRQNKREV